jgi:hypothetical protein
MTIEKTELENLIESNIIEDFELPGDTYVEIVKVGKKHFYMFKDKKGNEIVQREGTTPNRVTENSSVGKEIKRILDPDDKFNAMALKKDFILAMQAMQEYWKAKEAYDIEQNEMSSQELELLNQENINNGFKHLDEIDRPILWTASNIDWYTAGERMNILLAWICFCGQVVLKEQMSVIVEGEGGTGKTHIQTIALDMIPEEYVLNMKSSTMAAVYAMSDTDPWYFDGKIVNMGDLGGDSDHEEADEFKNIMKELQSDGYVKRIKMVLGAGGEQTPKEYVLEGYPIITYTNVPGFIYDDQEMSRSIILQPRKDHKDAFMIFKRLNKQRGTDSACLIKEHCDMIPFIKNMVRALRDRMESVTIYNPYWSFMEEYLANSKYIFRDTDKYDAILRVITAINGYNRKIYDVNGQQTLFTTREDIGFFLELLDQYHKSIVSNMSPGAMELLDILTLNEDVWFNDDRGNDKQHRFNKGLTISEYMEESSTRLSRATLQKYFKELSNVGYLKLMDKRGQEYVYEIGKDSALDKMGNVRLSKIDKKIMEFNYGSEITSTFEFEELSSISLWDMHPEIEPPMWNKYLPTRA